MTLTPSASATVVVSVIMPACNVERYVQDAIESVLAQRFDGFELLVADDASDDGTWAIVERYASYPNVRVFRHPQRQGAAHARNRMIREARGSYVTPCDADDLLLPGNLKRLSGFLDEHPDVGTVYADIWSVRTEEHDRVVESPSVCGADCRTAWDLFENVVNHGGSMSRREILLAVSGYDEHVFSVDDWSLWLKVAEIARIHYLPGEVYYLWRRHPRTMTRTEEHYQASVRKIVREAAVRRGFELPGDNR